MSAKNTMSCKHLHLCIVSKQPTPNIVPLLDQHLQVDEVILIHTNSFKIQAQRLAKALQYYQIKSQLIPLSHYQTPAELREFFIQLVDTLLSKNENIRLYANLTGGTKSMSLALYEVALMTESDGTHAYYMNTDDTLIWYLPKSKADSAPYDLEDRIKLTPFLIAHGWKPLTKPKGTDHPQWRPLTEQLLNHIEDWQQPLTQLNFIATNAKNKELRSKPPHPLNAPLKRLIDLLQDAGLLQLENNTVQFSDDDARFFCNGGWLEEAVFHALKQLSSKNRKIQDYAQGLEIQFDLSNTQNELDAVALVDNKLVIIECKTHNTKANPKILRDSLFKLGSLIENIGGVMARGLLISMHTPSKSDFKRAEQLQIPIIYGKQIAQLKTHLAKHL